jgi:hypothetical protein
LRKSAKDLNHTRSNLGIEVLEQLLLLINEIVSDTGAQVAALSGYAHRDRAAILRVGGLLGVPLLRQRADYTTRRALVQEQSICQRTQPQGSVLHQRLKRVALGDGDVVTADPVSIAKLIDPHQIGDCGVQIGSIAIESRVRRFVLLFGCLRHRCY